MNPEQLKRYIAWRCAQELTSGVVNLGIGIPSMVSDYLSPGAVTLHSENGMLGVGPLADAEHADPELANASRTPVTALPHASFFDISVSLGMMRGGHVDATVIGALQVSETGDIASWAILGQDVLGVGGAMDLVIGAKRVIVAMMHTNSSGEPKIVVKCDHPLTAKERVETIVTEYAVFKFRGKKLFLVELVDELSLEQLKAITPAAYEIDPSFAIVSRNQQLDTIMEKGN